MNSNNNHVVYSHSGVDWNPVVDGDFNVRFGSCTREPTDFRTETLLTAELINSSMESDYCIGISGGIDSEIVARAFFECGFDFTPIVFKFKDDWNRSENELAFSFLNYYGVKPEIIELDIIEYFTKDVLEIAEQFRVAFRTLPYLYWLNTKTELPMINGSGLANIFQHPKREKEMCFTVSNCINPYPQLKHTGVKAVPEFFFYTPEMMASVLLDEDVKKFCELGWTTSNKGLDSWKMWFIPKYYENDKNPIELRKKKHGFEKIMETGIMADTGWKLEPHLKNYQVCSWEHSDFLSSLLGEKEWSEPELIKDRVDFYA